MNKTNFLAKMKQKGTFFYWGIVILPILNYLIFFIGVNINNILMAFKEYSVVNYEKQISWVGFANFTKIFQDSEVLGYLVKNSLFCGNACYYHSIDVVVCLLHIQKVYRTQLFQSDDFHAEYRLFDGTCHLLQNVCK